MAREVLLLRCIRERAYQLWEQEGRPEDRRLDHWLQAEREHAMHFEFKNLMRAYRTGIISETTVEQVMTELEKRALSNGLKIPTPSRG